MPEACRLLLSLAVTEMDSRFAGLVLPLAEAMGGENAFVRACEHVHTALQAARRATGLPVQTDPQRARFIEQTVKVALTDRGAADRFRPLAFLPVEGEAVPKEEVGSHTRAAERKKRKFRPGDDLDEMTP
jgi:hypothetical protein